ncbi:hypothetical protein [Nonomuraea sp. NPDC049709]|uniref:hypothetical protein n=1 Tax=Nonomuraea sp. NPDC049709 TaxID=3154736 RepID=UPI00343FA077
MVAGGAVGAFGRGAEPLPPPAPLVDSVGDIAGLVTAARCPVPTSTSSTHCRVPTTNRYPASWPTVAVWLRAGKSAATPLCPAERPGQT